MTVGFLIPVGPGDHELDRLDDLLDSVEHFCDRRTDPIVVIDDEARPRTFRRLDRWARRSVVRTSVWAGRPPDAYTAMIAGTLAGLDVLARQDVDAALKLDTDALLIDDPRARIEARFRDDLGLAVIGAHEHSPGGGRRDWSGWTRHLRLTASPVSTTRTASGALRLHHRSRRARATAASRVAQARDNGYRDGEHCLGGAYAVGRSLLLRRDLLDPHPWLRTRLGEDIVIGVLARAAGLRLADAVEPGEPFGVRHVGLPDTPEALVADCYAVVHSVKDTDPSAEAELRARFRALRAQRISVTA